MSDDAVTTPPAGVSVGINVMDPVGSPAGRPFIESVPEPLRDKEWVSVLSKHQDPWNEMFNKYDNMLGLMGRKSEGLKVPGEGATPEDWSNFHKAIGVPETPDKYEYKAPEVSEKLKPYYAQDEALLNAMREAAIKAGVRPEGFKHLAEVYDKYYVSELEKAVSGAQETLSKLENGFKEKFGERSQQVLDGWKNSFGSLLGKEQAAIIESLDPAIKTVLAEHYEAFAKKYIREGDLNLDVPNKTGALTSNNYAEQYREGYARLRSTTPGSPEHFEAQRRLNELRESGRQAFKK